MRIRTDGRGGQADGRRERRMDGGGGTGGWTGDRRMDGGNGFICHARNSILKSNPRFVERDILGYIIKDYY